MNTSFAAALRCAYLTPSNRARFALASAGATLRSLVDLVASVSDEAQALSLSEPADRGVGGSILSRRIEDLDLSERPRNCLLRERIQTVGAGLVALSDSADPAADFTAPDATAPDETGHRHERDLAPRAT